MRREIIKACSAGNIGFPGRRYGTAQFKFTKLYYTLICLFNSLEIC